MAHIDYSQSHVMNRRVLDHYVAKGDGQGGSKIDQRNKKEGKVNKQVRKVTTIMTMAKWVVERELKRQQ